MFFKGLQFTQQVHNRAPDLSLPLKCSRQTVSSFSDSETIPGNWVQQSVEDFSWIDLQFGKFPSIQVALKLVSFPSSNPKTNCSQELCFVKWQLQSRLTISSFPLSQQFLYVDASDFLFCFVFTERRRIQFLVISKKSPILLVFPCRGFHFAPHSPGFMGLTPSFPLAAGELTFIRLPVLPHLNLAIFMSFDSEGFNESSDIHSEHLSNWK